MMRGTPERQRSFFSELSKISVTKDRNLSDKKKSELKDETPTTTEDRRESDKSMINLKSLHMSRLPSESTSSEMTNDEDVMTGTEPQSLRVTHHQRTGGDTDPNADDSDSSSLVDSSNSSALSGHASRHLRLGTRREL